MKLFISFPNGCRVIGAISINLKKTWLNYLNNNILKMNDDIIKYGFTHERYVEI